jgi:acyl carrier protein
MELKEFVQNVATQFEDVNEATISAQNYFREIEGWSSFTALSIIAMVDYQYKVKLKADDIRQSQTIEDLYKIVKSKI